MKSNEKPEGSKSTARNEKENIYSLKGFDKVFKFTLKQTFKNKAYIVSLVMFILIMSLMGPIQYFSMKSGMDAGNSVESDMIEKPVSEKIIIYDATNLNLDVKGLRLKDIGLEKIDIEIISGVPGDVNPEASGALEALGKKEILVNVSIEPEGYKVSAIRADDSEVPVSEVDSISSYISGRVNDIKIASSGVREDDVKLIQKGIYTKDPVSEEDYLVETSNAISNDKMRSLMLIYSILIMIVSTMSASYIIASVTEEKTSKLVEGLLVSVRPMALLMGKICGMMVYIITVLVCGFIGSQISRIVMKTAFGIDITSGAAQFDFSMLFKFGIGGLLVIIVSIILAYLAFGGLSGMMGSACTKTEDVQSATGSVMMIVMGGYLAATIIPGMNSDKAVAISSLVPPLSFYTAPVYFLTERISLPFFALSVAIQVFLVVAIMVICAKTYRRLILNDSSKPKLAEILKALKG